MCEPVSLFLCLFGCCLLGLYMLLQILLISVFPPGLEPAICKQQRGTFVFGGLAVGFYMLGAVEEHLQRLAMGLHGFAEIGSTQGFNGLFQRLPQQ